MGILSTSATTVMLAGLHKLRNEAIPDVSIRAELKSDPRLSAVCLGRPILVKLELTIRSVYVFRRALENKLTSPELLTWSQ